MILDTFELRGSGRIAKESVEMISQKIMSGQASTVVDAAGPMMQGMKQDEQSSYGTTYGVAPTSSKTRGGAPRARSWEPW